MITLHALDQSRSLRILWLLELLGVPYELTSTDVIPKPCGHRMP